MPSGVVSQHIQTACTVKLLDTGSNAWEDFAGEDIVGDSVYWTAPTVSPYDYEQTWWGYRGQAAMCKPALEKGMTFDGTDDYITFGNNYGFGLTANFSLSVWVYLDAVQEMRLISKESATSGWFIRILSTGSIVVQRTNASGNDQLVASADTIGAGSWYLLTVTYDGSNIRLYMNGALVGSPQASTRSVDTNANNFHVGRQANAAVNYFYGKMWGMAVWTKALNATEVGTLYDINRVTSKQYEDAVNAISSLASYWRLSQSTGSMNDTIGAISGTVNGSPSRYTYGPFDVHSIVRARIGNGSSSNRQIYYQTITDPTTASEWTSWTSLYTGTWYAIGIYPDPSVASGYYIVHANSTTIYANNVSKLTVSNVVYLRPIPNLPGDVFYCVVEQNAQDSKRVMKWYYTTDLIAATAGVAWLGNYEWSHCDMAVHATSDGSWFNTIFSVPYFGNNPRNQKNSDALMYSGENNLDFNSNMYEGLFPLRGASGRAGVRQFQDLLFTDEPGDGYDYIFYVEDHRDTVTTNSLTNLRRPLVWQRSVNGWDGWTEPMPTGYSVWGFAGVIKVSGYLYAAGNGRVLRKYVVGTETDLSNYVLEGSLNIPRDNEKGSGTITLANPDNVVGELMGISPNQLTASTEQRVDVKLGQQVFLNEGYEWSRCNDWWLADHSRNKDTKTGTSRIVLKLGDFWHRLENKFRDRYYFPGEFLWKDWDTNGVNRVENWFSPTAQTLSRTSYTSGDDTSYYMTVPSGRALFTPWKGHSAKLINMSFELSAHANTHLIFRWKDARNHYRLRYQTSTVYLQEVRNGTVTDLASAAAGSTDATSFTLGVYMYFNKIVCTFNGVTKITHTLATFRRFGGHVGGYSANANWKMKYFYLQDIEAPISSSYLIKAALGYAGYPYVTLMDGINDVEQVSVLWGPQSDIETPAQALKKLLESNNLQVVCKWVNDIPTIYVDQFTGSTPDYSITDDIIEFSQVEEAKEKYNVVAVDGNEHSWTEYYRPDLVLRDRTIVEYLDLPELTTQGAVQARANEVLDQALRSNSPGGTVVWRPWYQKLDLVTWTDEFGGVWGMRIEGLQVQWNQGKKPFQRAIIDGGPLLQCDPAAPTPTYVAQDSFTRTSSSGWGTADTGGAWTVTGTGTLWTVADGTASVVPVAGTAYIATLGSVSMLAGTVKFRGSINKTSTAGYQNAGIIVHYVDSSNWLSLSLYMSSGGVPNLRIRKNLAGVQSVVTTLEIPELPYTFGEEFKLQVEVSAEVLKGKVWMVGEPEPSEYQLEYSITDAALQATGAIGFRAIIDSGATNHPVTFTVDDYEAWT